MYPICRSLYVYSGNYEYLEKNHLSFCIKDLRCSLMKEGNTSV